MTKIFNCKLRINEAELRAAATEIVNGNLVIFPTETVYGIGANAFDEQAVNKIFIAKERANDNPLIVHVSNYEMIESCVTHINEIEKKLIEAFMPGPFTLVLPKKDIIPYNVTAHLETVGIRMPNNKIAKALIEASGTPIAAPSANLSSKPSGTKIEDIKDEFDGKVNIIIDSGESEIGLESTVVKVINNIPYILRPGKITKEDIIKVVGTCIYYKQKDNEKVESPGLKYKHYAPSKKCILVYSENQNKLISEINKIKTAHTIIIGPNEYQDKIKSNYLSYGNNLNEISHNLFSLIRKADKLDGDLIVIIGVKNEGLGVAIMNRLLRSCSNNFLNF